MSLVFETHVHADPVSGHGVSGTLQVDVVLWIIVICMFIAGVATAMTL